MNIETIDSKEVKMNWKDKIKTAAISLATTLITACGGGKSEHPNIDRGEGSFFEESYKKGLINIISKH